MEDDDILLEAEAQAKAEQRKAALDRLRQRTAEAPQETQESGADDAGDNITGLDIDGILAGLSPAYGAFRLATDEDFRNAAGETRDAVVGDVLLGMRETPGAVVGGAYKAADSMIELHNEIGPTVWNVLQQMEAAGVVELPEGLNSFIDTIEVSLPDVGTPESNTGKAVQGITQFAVGFAGARKAAADLTMKLGRGALTRNALQGVMADFAAFTGDEGRLADMIPAEELPDFVEPAVAFMQSDEDDPEIVGRLKNSLEGAGLGIAFDGVTAALRGARQARRVAKSLEDIDATVGRIEDVADARAARIEEELSEFTGDAAAGRRIIDSNRPDPAVPGDPDQFFDNVLAGFDTDDEVSNYIRNSLAQDVQKVDAARRGTRSHEATKLASYQVDAFDALTQRRAGQPLSAEQATAVRRLWASSGQKVTDLAQALAAKPNSEGLAFAFRRSVALHRVIQAEAMGVRAEAGRLLDSFKIPVGASRQKMAQIDEVLAMSADGEAIDALAKRLAILGPDQAKVADNVIRKSWRAQSADAIGEVWRAALLSNPKTHIVNAVSNTAVALYDIAETFSTGALARVMGDDETAEMLAEAAMKFSGFRHGVDAQFKYFAQHQKFNNMGAGFDKVDARPQRAISSTGFGLREGSVGGETANVIGRVLSVPSELLGGADDFFKGINYTSELYGQAHRLASREVGIGLVEKADLGKRIAELIDEPTNAIVDAAREAAHVRTFTAPATGMTQGILRARRWMNGTGVPFGHIILPFVNTPANILKWTFSRTPAGYLMDDVKLRLARGGKEAAMANTQIAMGTSAMVLAIDLAANGRISGGGPSDVKQRQALQRTGWQPYSVLIGGMWLSFQRGDPIGNLFMMGADAHEIFANQDGDPDEEFTAKLGQMAGAIGNAMISKTYLTGLSDAFDVISDPDRYGPNYLNRILSSFVPAVSAETRRQIDPYMRDAHGIVNDFKNRIPGFSDELPTSYDLWGRPRMYQSHMGMAYDALSPFIARKIDPEPIDNELTRLGYYPAMPTRSLTLQGVEISLRNRPDIYQRYVQLAGEQSLPVLNEIIGKKQYDQLLDGSEPLPGSKAELIQRVISQSRKVARAQVFNEYHSDLMQMRSRQLELALEQARAQEAEELEAAAQALEQQ